MLPLSNYPVSAVSSLTIEGFSIPAAKPTRKVPGIYSPRQSWFSLAVIDSGAGCRTLS